MTCIPEARRDDPLMACSIVYVAHNLVARNIRGAKQLQRPWLGVAVNAK